MKSFIVNAMAAFAAASFMSSCSSDHTKVTPQGSITLENREVSSAFSSILVEDGLEVILSQDTTAAAKVQVETYSNVQSFIEVVSGSRNSLVIRVRKGTNFKGDPKVRIRLTAGDLQLIALSGRSRVTIASKLEGDGMMFELSGGSTLSGEVISKKLLTVALSGGSSVALTGSTDTYNISDGSGGSRLSGFDFVCNTVNANLSGGSQLSVTANKEIKVDISGGSKILYKGPKDQDIVKLINISGGSDVIRVD